MSPRYRSKGLTGIWRHALVLAFASVWLLAGVSPAAAQTYLETYGQNRVQYRRFDWKIFETTHFRVYHYDRSGKDLARYVAEQAESYILQAEKKTGGKFSDRFNIIVYNSFDEYNQTNVGRKNDALQVRSNESGKVNMVDDKLVVYFTGVHTELQAQIRNGISRVLLNQKMAGNNLKDQVRNSATLNIPEWVSGGYVSYLADGWNEKTDKDWKGLVEANPSKKFYTLAELNGALAGKAFWKYIAERYGKQDVRDLMSQMESRKNMNKALKHKYQLNVVKVFDSCLAFYKDAFLADAADKEVPDTTKAALQIRVPKAGTIIRDIRVSPRGGDVAYVKWKQGEFQVCLQQTRNEKAVSVILEGGMKNFNETGDPDYPLLAWSNTGFKLAILYKKGFGNRLRIYDAIKGKVSTYVIPNNRFDRALGMAFDEDNDGIILSAIRKSQTDLYLFTIRGARMKNITNDVWDDVQPAFVTGGRKRGIVFLSNRPKPDMDVPAAVNELPTGPMNVYFYDTKTQSRSLLQCSSSEPGAHVSQPIQFGSDNFAYLYDINGVRNKYVVVFGRDRNNMDSAYWLPAANLSHSLVSHQYNPAGNLVADVIRQDGFYNVYLKPLIIPGVDAPVAQPTPALLVEEESEKLGVAAEPLPAKMQRREESRRARSFGELDLGSGNTFQSEFAGNAPDTSRRNVVAELETAVTPEPEEELIHVPEADSSFMKMKAVRNRTGFRPDNFSVSLDNSLLFTKYQSAGQNGNQYANPPLSGLITMSLDDMLEDYRFTGGFRLPLQGVGSTYFLQFENARRRLDWNIAFVHTATVNNYNLLFTDTAGSPLFNTLGIGKTSTNLLQGTVSYPFDRFRSLRFQLGLRQDALNFKSIDTFSLIIPVERKYWTMSRLEYVFDNTTMITDNIRNGLRAKVFGEYMHQMNGDGGGLYNFGFDVRNYTKLYKNLIWAFRVAGAHSGGKQKILYLVGGVDNWLNKQTDPNSQVSQESYGFQSLATNLRGYKQSARTGNSYAVGNSEFRFPILTSLVRRPIQSKLLRSLQLVAFTDVGLAWNGLFPDAQNVKKSLMFNQPPVGVTVLLSNNTGVAVGYGAGLRMLVSGYSLRLDAAWNIEGITKPIWYLSMGTDF